MKVLLGTLLLFLFSQPGAATQSATASIEGRVVKAAGNHGLSEASVELIRTGGNPQTAPRVPETPPPK